jgi:hypothetical protein
MCVLASVALGASASAAKKEPPKYQPPPPTIIATPLALAIAGFDSNGDMVVTKAEFDAGVARSFVAADKDRDGRISLLELAEWSEAALGNRGALPGQFDFDRDGDDSISREEFVGLFNRRFQELDTNKDGMLQRSELVTFASTQPGRGERGRHAPRSEGRDGGPGPDGP